MTEIPNAIQNPNNPNHFMRIKPVTARVRVLRDGQVLADSVNAVRVLEVGRDLYDPVLYIPKDDVSDRLIPNPKQTHCPLKGDATYFDLAAEDGSKVETEIAWTYAQSFDFAQALKGRLGFYANKVTIEESPT